MWRLHNSFEGGEEGGGSRSTLTREFRSATHTSFTFIRPHAPWPILGMTKWLCVLLLNNSWGVRNSKWNLIFFFFSNQLSLEILKDGIGGKPNSKEQNSWANFTKTYVNARLIIYVQLVIQSMSGKYRISNFISILPIVNHCICLI